MGVIILQDMNQEVLAEFWQIKHCCPKMRNVRYVSKLDGGVTCILSKSKSRTSRGAERPYIYTARTYLGDLEHGSLESHIDQVLFTLEEMLFFVTNWKQRQNINTQSEAAARTLSPSTEQTSTRREKRARSITKLYKVTGQYVKVQRHYKGNN